MKSFGIMARLELINLFGINVIRHSKNTQEKKKRRFLIAVIVIVGVMLIGYSTAGAYALTTFRLTEKIPVLYFLLTFLLQLAFGLIKAKSTLYREKDLDMIAALPVSGSSVVAARVLRMYIEGVIITLGAFLPAMITFGVNSGAGVAFYLWLLPDCLILPIIPTAISAWIGILIASVISKARHKVLAEIVIMLILVLGMYLFMSLITTRGRSEADAEGRTATSSVTQSGDEKAAGKSLMELSEEEAKERIADAVWDAMVIIEEVVPPARFMGDLLARHKFHEQLIWAVFSMALVILTVAVIGRMFFRISRRLVTVTKHHEYRLESLKAESVITALVKKELARYTSSGVYITNTIIGPVLAVAFAIALAFFDPSQLISSAGGNGLPIEINASAGIPYLLGVFFTMMSISACSVSMEGKNWWLPRSLPLSAREILGSKLILHLIIFTPFYGLMEIILLFTLRTGFMGRLWLLIIPAVAVLFSALFGMVLNLRFPKFHWENATEVVKQSAATGLNILSAFVFIIPGAGAMFLPKQYADLLNLLFLIVLCIVCFRLYRKICRFSLEKLEG